MKTLDDKITIASLKQEITKAEKTHALMVQRVDELIEKALPVENQFPDGFLDILAMTVHGYRLRA